MRNYVGNNINAIRIHNGLSQEQFARLAEVSQTTVSAWECGQTFPRRSNINRLLKSFPELTLDDIFSEENGFARRALALNPNRSEALIPLYGSISAGKSLEMLPVMEYLDVSESLKERFPHAFFLRINGESMNRVLPNGSLALIDPTQREIVDNGIYALCINGAEAVVKRVRCLGRALVLLPDSTDAAFKETLLDWNPESQDSVVVFGRVVWYCLSPDARL